MAKHKQEFPPLLQAGFHIRTLAELEALTVSGFPLSTRRPLLWVNFTGIIDRLKQLGIRCDVWVSADIKWVRENSTKRSVLAQPQELDAVCKIIESKSERHTEAVTLTGNLVGINVARRTFMMEFPDAEPVAGVLAKEFDTTMPRTVNRRYRASLQKQTVVQYASDRDEITWILTDINDLN